MQALSRVEAGRRLAAGLGALVRDEPAVVALSPGGAGVAAEVATTLSAPLDIMAVVRLEVPGRPRSTFGAVANGAVLVLDEQVSRLGLPDPYVRTLVEIARHEVDRQTAAWRGEEAPIPVAGRTVVLVDDGLTEAVLVSAAATALVRGGAARVIYAAPTISPELWHALQACCSDRLVLFDARSTLGAYVCEPSFTQTTRTDVRNLIRRSRDSLAGTGS